MSKIKIDPNRKIFMRGVLVALASAGTVIHYDELRRLCRLSREQLGAYLGAAREDSIAADQPDFNAIVVNDDGMPGAGFSGAPLDGVVWAAQLREVHKYWSDRRRMDNKAFVDLWGDLPAVPGLSGIDPQLGPLGATP